MKNLILLFSLVLLSLPNAIAQKAEPGSQDWLKERLDKEELYITMRDGTRLFTSVYTPKDKSKDYPVLLIRTPYCIEGEGPDAYSRYLQGNVALINEGYIFALQDVRGKFMSEGEYVDVRPHNPKKKSKKDIDESSDTYDTIDWLIRNVGNNNGRVGIFGISYPGFYATMALIDAHPALKAASPQAPVTNWFIGDDFHHNGAFFILDAFRFYSSFGRPKAALTRKWKSGFDFPCEDNYDFFLELGPIRNAKDICFGDSIKFWNDLMSHPDYDQFWQDRNPLPHLKNVKAAVMTVGGWFDAEDSWGPQHVYKSIEAQNKPETSNILMMGPWFHGQWARNDGENLGNVFWGSKTSERYKEAEKIFFNHHLKDEGKMSLPEAALFITGSNEWKEFKTWPPKRTKEKTLYLHGNGKLSFAPPKIAESYDEYMSDPMNPVPYTEDVHLRRTREYMTDDQRFAARRPDVMVYESDILKEDLTIAGPVTPMLQVTTTGTDADYVVKLIDVFPDTLSSYPENEKKVPMAGYQMMVRGDILRGRYRNSFEHPEAFVPNEVTPVNFEMPGVAHTFKKGHRIMIQVQHSWFPLVDRNPQKFVNIYECGEEDFQKAMHRIYHEKDRASGVKILVLE